MIFPKRGADGIVSVRGGMVAVEHSHDQAERLGGAEEQRRQPDASADPVAAVAPASRLDGDVASRRIAT
jgi:hypothetical protein